MKYTQLTLLILAISLSTAAPQCCAANESANNASASAQPAILDTSFLTTFLNTLTFTIGDMDKILADKSWDNKTPQEQFAQISTFCDSIDKVVDEARVQLPHVAAENDSDDEDLPELVILPVPHEDAETAQAKQLIATLQREVDGLNVTLTGPNWHKADDKRKRGYIAGIRNDVCRAILSQSSAFSYRSWARNAFLSPSLTHPLIGSAILAGTQTARMKKLLPENIVTGLKVVGYSQALIGFYERYQQLKQIKTQMPQKRLK